MSDTDVINGESYMQSTDVRIRPSRTFASTDASRAGNVYHLMPSGCQLTLPELVRSYPLPRIVRYVGVGTEPGDDNQIGDHTESGTGRRQGQLDLTCPILAYCFMKVTRVSAYCLHYESSLRDYLLLDRALLIPDSYTGWFRVLGPPSAGFRGPEVEPHIRSVSGLASRSMSQFLVGGSKSLSGVMVLRQQDQDVTNIPCRVLPGTLLTTAGLYRDTGSLRPHEAAGCTSPVAPRLFLKCVDEHHRELFFDVRETGIFYLVNGHGSPSPLYRMADILLRFKLPVIVHLVYGRSPPSLPSHTFLLSSSSQCRSLLVSPLSSSNLTAEVPLDADLKFEVSPCENSDETRVLEAKALQHCWETASCSVTDIKVVLETPPRVHDYQEIDNPDSPSPQLDLHGTTNKPNSPSPLLSSQSVSDLSQLSDWSFLSKCILVSSDSCPVYESYQVYPTAIEDFCLSTCQEKVCGKEAELEARQLPLLQRKINLVKQNCVDDPQYVAVDLKGSRREVAHFTTFYDSDSKLVRPKTISKQSGTSWIEDSVTSPNCYTKLETDTDLVSENVYTHGYEMSTQLITEIPENAHTHSINNNCLIEPTAELPLKLDIASNSRLILPPKPHKAKQTPHPNKPTVNPKKPTPNPKKPTPLSRKPMTDLVNIYLSSDNVAERNSETVHGLPQYPASGNLTETQDRRNSMEFDDRQLVRVDKTTLSDLDNMSFSTFEHRMPLSGNRMFPYDLSESSIKNSSSDTNFTSEYISPIPTEYDIEYTSLISSELDYGNKLDGTRHSETPSNAAEVFPIDSGMSESSRTDTNSQTHVKSVSSTTSIHKDRIISADSGNSTQTYPKSPSSSSCSKPTLWSVSEHSVFTSGESSLTQVKSVSETSTSCERKNFSTSESSLTYLKTPYVVTSNKNIYQKFPFLSAQTNNVRTDNIINNNKNMAPHTCTSVPDKLPHISAPVTSEMPLGTLAHMIPQFRSQSSAPKISPTSIHPIPISSYITHTPGPTSFTPGPTSPTPGPTSPTPGPTSPTPSRYRAPQTKTAQNIAPPLPDRMTPGSCIVKMCSNLTNRFTEASKNELIDQMVKAGVSRPTELALRSLQVADYIYLMDRKDDLDKALVTFLPKLGKFDLRTIAMCFNGLRLTT